MKIDKFIKRIEALAAVMASEQIKNRVSFVAVSRLAGLYETRIFREGEATGGGKIGRYSTKPYYTTSRPKLLPKSKLSPLGKNGKSTFKNGKKKKTRYLPGGYSEFRERTVGQNKTVDLNLTGATVGSLAIGRRAGRVVYGFTNQKAAEIMEENEKRFKKEITKPTAAEIKAAGEAALNEFSTILLEIYGK